MAKRFPKTAAVFEALFELRLRWDSMLATAEEWYRKYPKVPLRSFFYDLPPKGYTTARWGAAVEEGRAGVQRGDMTDKEFDRLRLVDEAIHKSLALSLDRFHLDFRRFNAAYEGTLAAIDEAAPELDQGYERQSDLTSLKLRKLVGRVRGTIKYDSLWGGEVPEFTTIDKPAVQALHEELVRATEDLRQAAHAERPSEGKGDGGHLPTRSRSKRSAASGGGRSARRAKVRGGGARGTPRSKTRKRNAKFPGGHVQRAAPRPKRRASTLGDMSWEKKRRRTKVPGHAGAQALRKLPSKRTGPEHLRQAHKKKKAANSAARRRTKVPQVQLLRADEASARSGLSANAIRIRAIRDRWVIQKSGHMNCYRLDDLQRTWPNKNFDPSDPSAQVQKPKRTEAHSGEMSAEGA